MKTHVPSVHKVHDNLHDSHHRRHLVYAVTVCVAEVSLIVVVHEMFVHLLFVAGVLGHDAVTTLLSD
jgi:hypothetical protein